MVWEVEIRGWILDTRGQTLVKSIALQRRTICFIGGGCTIASRMVFSVEVRISGGQKEYQD